MNQRILLTFVKNSPKIIEIPKKKDFKMDIRLNLLKKRVNILIILSLFSGSLLWILVPLELSPKSPETSLALIKNSDLETSTYLTIQSNSLLPISSINLDDSSLTKTNGGETIMATITGYILVEWETNDEPCILASGLNACEETDKDIVACPRKYPFGTKVLIEEKVYVCEDITNIKYDDIFDILFRTEEEMNKWGKRILPVTILN